MSNIAYQTPEIARHYSRARRTWADLYPSEQWGLDRVIPRWGMTVLDVGCAAGGLLHALRERWQGDIDYTGVDINAEAIATGRDDDATFICGDICEMPSLREGGFDLVTALGTADWNVETKKMIEACWANVGEGGQLVVSLRLTTEQTVSDIARSYQPIWFGDGDPPADCERAVYGVYNTDEATEMLRALHPAKIETHGYWGKPSPTACTPFNRVLFTVFVVTR